MAETTETTAPALPAPNPYLEAMRGGELATGSSTPGSGNPFLDLMRGEEDAAQQRMRATTTRAMGVNPDKYATQKKVAQYLGYPTAAVEALPVQTEREAKLKQVQQDTAISPVLQRKFTDEDFARLAHDDTTSLATVADWFVNSAKYLASHPSNKNTLAGDVGAGINRANRGAAGTFQALAEYAAMGTEAYLPVLRFNEEQGVAGGNPLRRLAEGFAGKGAESEARAKALSPAAGGVQGGVSSGVQSLTSNSLALMMAFLPGGQNAAMGEILNNTFGQAYQQAREQGLGANRALPFAVSQTAIEYATEKIPLTKLLGDVKAATPLLQTIAKQMALEIPGEQVATVLQDMNEWAALPENASKSFNDYLAERPNAALQTLIATAVGVGGNVAIARGVQGLVGDQDEQRKAQQDAQALQDLFSRAAASKTRERSPESFGALVQELAADSEAPKEVRFDARTLLASFQQAGLDEAQVQQMLPSVLSQMREALVTGGEVTVPIGELVNVVGTDLEQVLAQSARIGENELSADEAKAAGEQSAKLLAEESQRVIAQAADQQAMEQGGEAVKATVLEQLNATKRFRPDVNDAYATLVRDFYVTMAGRLGVTPDTLYQRYPLRVQGTRVDGEDLNQAAFHGTPHRGIEQFTTAKMGTGEGVQAYGWGLYFAQNKDIAEFYRQKLTNDRQSPAWYGARNALANELGALDFLGFDRWQDAYTALKQDGLDGYDVPPEAAQRIRAAMDAYAAMESNPGQLYEVNVPEDEDLLDYDARLKDQPEKVRTALEKVGIRLVDFNVVDPSGKVLTSQESREQARTYITRNNVAGKIIETPTEMTGKRAYNLLSKKLGGDEAASKALHAAGIPGLRFLDAGSRGDQAQGKSHNYVIFDDSAVTKTREFYQGNKSPRGTFNPNTLTTSLLEKADLSTFLHETGHAFLTIMSDMAARPDAPAGVKSDMDALLKWFKVKDLDTWNSMTLDQQRKYHERFAESFEQYLLEGKAPSVELQPLFQRFRSWLINVYRSLTQFMKTHDTQLSDEVRGVFDRLLASGEQIQQAEALRAYAPKFESPEQAGMTPEEWTAYQQQGQKATATALDDLGARSVKNMRWLTNARSKALKALQKDSAAKRKGVEAEVAEEVAKFPIYQAMRWLRKGEMVTEQGEEIKAEKGFRLNTEALAEMYPESALDRPDLDKLKGMTAANGLHPDLVAEMFGFSSGDQLVRALADVEPMASVMEGITDRRMLERFGDLATEQGLERAADEAVHNEARGRFVATELRALQKANAETERTPAGGSVNVMVRAAKNFARDLVARRKVRDLKPGQHVAAETRAAKAAALALRGGKTREAIVATRDELLNHYAARETYRALDEVDRSLAYLKKFDKDATRKKLPPEYLDQIDKLLERVELRQQTNRALDKRAKLSAWLKDQEAMGIEVDLPAAVQEDAQLTNYREMTLEEFRGLVDTIKQIEHLGRLKDKLLTAKDQREFDAIRDSIVKSILENGQGRKANTRTPTTNLGRALQGIKSFGAAHVKAATWARVLDGGKDGGPVWEYFIRSANERGDTETTMRAKATKDLTEIMAPLLKAGKLGGKGQFYPSINRSLNRESVLAIALNVGNESNLQRLLGGEGWTVEQLKPVLDTVTPAEWAAVQKVWDYFESYRPLIAEKEKRVFGKEPEWIEPGSSLTEDYNVKGGYYPVKYDPAASVRAEEHADAEGAKRQLQGAYGAATTKRSFTKARAEEVVGRPLLYTLNGVYSGVNDVIHDLAWHEWLIDVNRLLRSKGIDSAIRETYGPEVVRQFKTWRDDIAEGESQAQGALDMGLGRLRQSVSVAGLGFNVMSALMQPLGLTQSITRVGVQWIGKGMMEYIGAPVESTREVNEKSKFMANRSRTRFRELNELRNRVQGQTGLKRVINENAYVLMMRVQQMVDVPTWLGAYEKAIADGNTEDRSVALADQAVIDSQGGGQTKDLAAIERGGPAQKLFTVFYSFMNTALNLGVASKMTPKSRAKFAVDMLMLYAVPGVLGAVLKDALTPGDDGDDQEKLVKKLAAEQISYLLGLVVLGREFSAAAKLVTGAEGARDYTGPAGVRAIADAYQFTKQASQGEFDDAFRKAAVNLAGDLIGLPSAQINRTITGSKALAEGKTQNPAAIALGYQEPK